MYLNEMAKTYENIEQRTFDDLLDVDKRIFTTVSFERF